MKLLAVIWFCAVLTACNGYRILGLFPFNGKSHFVMFERLMKDLADKGHQVDIVSTFPLKKPYPNYTDLITLKAPIAFVNNMTFEYMKNMIRSSPGEAIATLAGTDVCESMADPKIKQLVKNPPKDPPYDVVLVEIFGAHCYIAIGHLLKVPIIGVSSSVLYPWHSDMIGNPENLAFMANNLLPYPQQMTFWQRVHNFLSTIHQKYKFNKYSAVQTDMARKYLDDESIPDVRTLERSLSMIIANSFRALNGIKDTTVAYVEVGGLHVRDDGVELAPSLEKWMNESTHGFVYFTFGSMVKIESFPMKYLDVFYKSLGKIAPIRVLMKIPNPNELPPGLPKNILTLPWIPQVKVLQHRNIKAFITHGGLMGTQEAVTYGVPLVGIPLFADQFINIDVSSRLNIAVGLDLETLTEQSMDNALNAVLNDPKYRESAKKLSAKFVDRPLSTADTAVYWVEYIVRHGADALRTPAMDLTWWQVQLLDVYLFLVASAVLAVYLLIATVKFIFGLINVDHPVSHKKKVS